MHVPASRKSRLLFASTTQNHRRSPKQYRSWTCQNCDDLTHLILNQIHGPSIHLALLMLLLLVGQGRAQGKVWWLRPNCAMTVGRKGASLLIDDDHSVSRCHATLHVGRCTANATPDLSVSDHASKFGVHINARPCAPNAQTPLSHGDTLTFGAQGSTFVLRSCRVAFCLANAHDIPADRLTARAAELGIDVVDSVDSCTHLITPTLAVTSKLIAALVFGCPIASPDFLDIISALPSVLTPPDPAPDAVDSFINSLAFLPRTPLPRLLSDTPVDLSAVDWHPNPERKLLFRGKLFVFSTQARLDKYKPMIHASGGSTDTLSCVPLLASSTPTDPDLIRKALVEISTASAAIPGEHKPPASVCLVLPQTPPPNDHSCPATTTADFVKELARSLGLRPISESEIGLAVLFVANDIHTNPNYMEEDPDSCHDTPSSTNVDSTPAATDNAVSTSAGRPPRLPRKGTRYSSFWSSMVAGNPLPPESDSPSIVTEQQPAAPDSPPNADSVADEDASKSSKASQIPRRRKGIDAFWSASVKGNDGIHQPVADSPSATSDQPNDDGGSMPSRNDSGVHSLDKADQAFTAPPRIVPLIKPRQQTGPIDSPPASDTSVPNFKRFRKTVHLYR